MLIAYVGPFPFPSSNANALRVKGVVDALKYSGHQVLVCPGVTGPETTTEQPASPGIEVHEINEYSAGFGSSLTAGLRGLFLGDVTIRWLQSLPHKPAVVILYGTHLGYLLRLLKYCRRESIRLLLDVVEWYDPRHLPGGLLGPFALGNEISMRWGVTQADGILVISGYLENYYRSKGCRTLRVPPLVSYLSIRPPQLREENGLLNLCYAGTLGKKEDFGVLVEGVERAVAAGVKLKMHIAGISAQEFFVKYSPATSFLSKNEGVLKFYGHLSNDETRRLVSSADFLLLARKPLRFANAGFPFKVAESLMLGTPVITNQFSDIPDYLEDGKNSFIIELARADLIAKSILRAASLDKNSISCMKICAMKTGKKFFSSEAKAIQLNEFIGGTLAEN